MVTDFATTLLDVNNSLPVTNTSNVNVFISVVMPDLASGDYFFSPEISVGDKRKMVRLKTYSNLIHLKCLNDRSETLGLMKVEYNVMVKEFSHGIS